MMLKEAGGIEGHLSLKTPFSLNHISTTFLKKLDGKDIIIARHL
jgi:hypothetical protein